MAKERTPEEVYEDLSSKGEYEEAHFDRDEVTKVKVEAFEDYNYGKRLQKEKDTNWRVMKKWRKTPSFRAGM